MANVVINEFEVIAEPRSPQRAAPAEPGAAEGAAPTTPQANDIRPALQQLESQALRVWAH